MWLPPPGSLLLKVSSSTPTLGLMPEYPIPPPPPPAVLLTVWTVKTIPSAPAPSLSPMPTGFVIWKLKNVEKEASEAREKVFVRKALPLCPVLFVSRRTH